MNDPGVDARQSGDRAHRCLASVQRHGGRPQILGAPGGVAQGAVKLEDGTKIMREALRPMRTTRACDLETRAKWRGATYLLLEYLYTIVNVYVNVISYAQYY